jgi:pyruvate dehydrogenase E2 component (dihydrolipoamide acetyltransferase)
MRAAAIAAKESERFRMQLSDDRKSFVLHSAVNVGFAVGMDDGLVVPVVLHADELSVYEIAESTKDLAARARSNALKPGEYGCGIITVSNLGMYGVLSFTPIINQPEASILGIGAPTERFVSEHGGMSLHKFITLSVTFDHRIINGSEAAEFASRVKNLIETPELLI